MLGENGHKHKFRHSCGVPAFSSTFVSGNFTVRNVSRIRDGGNILHLKQRKARSIFHLPPHSLGLYSVRIGPGIHHPHGSKDNNNGRKDRCSSLLAALLAHIATYSVKTVCGDFNASSIDHPIRQDVKTTTVSPFLFLNLYIGSSVCFSRVKGQGSRTERERKQDATTNYEATNFLSTTSPGELFLFAAFPNLVYASMLFLHTIVLVSGHAKHANPSEHTCLSRPRNHYL